MLVCHEEIQNSLIRRQTKDKEQYFSGQDSDVVDDLFS